MFYPVVIENPANEREAFGVVVPDLPGCHSAGDTLDEAMTNARRAVEFHLEGLSEEGAQIPVPKPVAHHQADPQFKDWIWALVEVDAVRYMGKAEKINVTLPGLLIRRIDDAVKKSPGETRSGFLAKAALDRLAAEHALSKDVEA